MTNDNGELKVKAKKREEGHYWVEHGDIAEPAFYDAHFDWWLLPGDREHHPESDFEKIGERVTRPDSVDDGLNIHKSVLASNRTPEVEDLIKRFDCPIEEISGGDMSHFHVANAIFMADRSDIDLIKLQTVAKERIRWLAVQNEKLITALSQASGSGDELHEMLCQAHMAGQYNEGSGVDPSYSNAQLYADKVIGFRPDEPAKPKAEDGGLLREHLSQLVQYWEEETESGPIIITIEDIGLVKQAIKALGGGSD